MSSLYWKFQVYRSLALTTGMAAIGVTMPLIGHPWTNVSAVFHLSAAGGCGYELWHASKETDSGDQGYRWALGSMVFGGLAYGVAEVQSGNIPVLGIAEPAVALYLLSRTRPPKGPGKIKEVTQRIYQGIVNTFSSQSGPTAGYLSEEITA